MPRIGKNPDVVAISYLAVNQPQQPTLDGHKPLLDLTKPRANLHKFLRPADGVDKVFVNSMSDTFHEAIPFEVIDEWFALFREFPDLQFQVLTKRTNRMLQYFKSGRVCPDNVWLGTSVGDRWHAFRVKTLAKIPAKIHFVSFEPLLGPIEGLDLSGIQWAIVGGESDYKAPRPMAPEWAHIIRRQCEAQNVAFFYKQSGGVGSDGAGGDKLDGLTYKAFPRYLTHEVKN